MSQNPKTYGLKLFWREKITKIPFLEKISGSALLYLWFYTKFYNWLFTIEKYLPRKFLRFHVPLKVFLDTFIATPFVFLPWFYAWMGVFYDKRSFSESFQTWGRNVFRYIKIEIDLKKTAKSISNRVFFNFNTVSISVFFHFSIFFNSPKIFHSSFQ